MTVLCLSNFIASLGLMVLIPFLALYVRELGVEDDAAVKLWTGFIVGAAPLTAAIMAGVWGAIGDQVGRRAMVIRALLGVSVFVGLMACATEAWHLLVLRVAQGCFSGFFAPSLTLASVLVPPERQGRLSGTMQMSVLAGSVSGPLVASWSLDHLGFRGMIAACSVLAFGAALLVRTLVPEPPRDVEPDGAALDIGPSIRSVLRRAVRDVATVLADRRVQPVFLAMLMMRLASAAQLPTLSLYVEKLCAPDPADPRVIGVVFASGSIAVLLTLPLWGRLADRWAARRQLTLCVGGGALFTLAAAFARDPYSLAALRFAAEGCLAGVVPAGFAMVARTTASARRGGAVGTAFSSLALGLALGPFLAAVIDPLIGYRAVLIGCAALLLLATRYALAADSGRRPAPPAAGDIYSFPGPR